MNSLRISDNCAFLIMMNRGICDCSGTLDIFNEISDFEKETKTNKDFCYIKLKQTHMNCLICDEFVLYDDEMKILPIDEPLTKDEND